jgi:uncharacterized membrane protein
MAHKEHFLEQHDPGRKDFQVDRIILFSDAVFAIAITLLIIEIKPPHVTSHSLWEQFAQFTHLIPQFVGLMISFFVIAIYWRSHHRIFGFVSNYSNKLIWINMAFLFTIVLMPFSSAYYTEYHYLQFPYIFYNLNIALTGLVNYFFIRYVFNPKNELIDHQPTAIFIHLFKARSIAIPTFFFATTLLAFAGYVPQPVIYILIWPMLAIIERIIKRKFIKQLPPATPAPAEPTA